LSPKILCQKRRHHKVNEIWRNPGIGRNPGTGSCEEILNKPSWSSRVIVVNPEQSEGSPSARTGAPYQGFGREFNQRDVKVQAAIEESKKDKLEDTLSAVIASEFVIGENTWRRKNYRE
jgi:hypothetical protein